MRAAVLVALSVALIAPAAASADNLTRLHEETGMAVAFWAARGVTGCEQGIRVEIGDHPLQVGLGGHCLVSLSSYWLPPNRWASDEETECQTIFHEVGHALLGVGDGGVDGQGHTATGLMAAVPTEMPWACHVWARARIEQRKLTRRVTAARSRYYARLRAWSALPTRSR